MTDEMVPQQDEKTKELERKAAKWDALMKLVEERESWETDWLYQIKRIAEERGER